MKHADYNFFRVALKCDKPAMVAAAKKTADALDKNNFFSKEAYGAINEWMEVCKKENENFYGTLLRQMATLIESFSIMNNICGGDDRAKMALQKIEQMVAENATVTPGAVEKSIKEAEGLVEEKKAE